MNVAVIAYHTGDEYENSYSIARLNYYNVSGVPIVKFDGVLSVSGGGGNMYPTYLSKYNTRIAIPSSYTIEVTGTNSGMIEYDLDIAVEKVASGIDNPVMHVVVTESHIPDSWGGLSEVNYAERLMAPNQNGTLLDFSGSDIQQVDINLMLDQSWVNEECELVVFLQNNQTKEILQGVKYNISDFATTNLYDASIMDIIVPKTVCNEKMTPKALIANYGLENINSLDLSFKVNGNLASSFEWSGNLAYLETELVTFPEVNFSIEPSNEVEMTVENPNGQTDQYPSNDVYSDEIAEAQNVPSQVIMILSLDGNPGETTWEVVDSQGNVIYQGGPYTGQPSTIVEQFVFTDPDCYSFIIYDEGGDGLSGGGIYKLAYGNPPTFFAQGNNFGYEEHVQFGVGLTGEEELYAGNGIELYPNPTDRKALVSFELKESNHVEMQIFNLLGDLLYTTGKKQYSSGKHTLEFDGKGLSSGIYHIHLKVGERTEVKKLIIR